MARFTSLPDTVNIVPQPRPAVNIPKLVNFTGNPYFGLGMGGIDAARQKLAEAAAQGPSQSFASPLQGASYVIDKLGNQMREEQAMSAEKATREQLASLVGGIDPTRGPTQEQIGQAMAIDPQYGNQLFEVATKMSQAAARQEHWVDIPTPPGETGSWQQNSINGEKRRVGSTGTTVNVNPPSAETAAKLGLAQGFTDNYDAIMKSIDAGEMTGPVNYFTSVKLGRGNGGAMYRNILQGTEALVRLMTGAGMNEEEARARVTQFEPDLTDDAATLRSKVEGLKQALDNVQNAVKTRGQPQKPDPTTPDSTTTKPKPDTTTTTTEPDTTTPPAPDDNIPTFDAAKPGDMATYHKLPKGSKYRVKGDPSIHTTTMDPQ